MQDKNAQTEYWLRGPITGVPPLLQPVAHALLQARMEIENLLEDFQDWLLWQRPAGIAAVGFHLQHLTGVLHRLFTYAGGGMLSDAQLQYLQNEVKEDASLTSRQLVARFSTQVDASVAYLQTVDVNSLTDVRAVGRKQVPSTVMGLLFHAAEHTMRHTGQLYVTVKFLQSQDL